jgi:hypothetical protein
MTIPKRVFFFKASIRLVQNDTVHCLHEPIQPVTQHFLPAVNAGEIQPHAMFEVLPNLFAVVDACRVLIQADCS